MYPQVGQVDEWPKTGQLNAHTDPIYMQLLGAKQVLELSTKSDNQFHGATRGVTFVQGKPVSPGKKLKIYRTHSTIRPYLNSRKVLQQDNNINASQKISSKNTVSMISIIF